jgi:hypothetical protein
LNNIFASKTRRAQTFEEKRKKITLKKQMSQNDNDENNFEVCINNKKIMNAKQEDLVNSLTQLIMDDGK